MCKDWGCVYLVPAKSSRPKHFQFTHEMEATSYQWVDVDVHMSFGGLRDHDGQEEAWTRGLSKVVLRRKKCQYFEEMTTLKLC